MKEEKQQLIFNNWLDRYRALLFKVVRAYTRTYDDQDDLFQEICLQIWRSVPNFKEQSAVSTWLYRIAINTALNWKRKERKHQEGKQEINNAPNLLTTVTDERDERLDWIYEEIAALRPLDKSLALLLLDGYSYKEMSTILGLTNSNVGVRINRIKNRLITRSQKLTTHGN